MSIHRILTADDRDTWPSSIQPIALEGRGSRGDDPETEPVRGPYDFEPVGLHARPDIVRHPVGEAPRSAVVRGS